MLCEAYLDLCRRSELLKSCYLCKLAQVGSGGEGELLFGKTERACRSPVLKAVRLIPFLFKPAAAAAAMTT